MATQVLRPHDLFADRRFRHHSRPLRRRKNIAVDFKLEKNSDSDRGKTSPRSGKRRSKTSSKKDEVPSGGLVNGQVTLLKRGEPLDLTALKANPNPCPEKTKPIDEDLMILDLGKIVFDSCETLPKQQLRTSAPTPANRFAGSVISSPSPRALPLPSFFNLMQQDEPVVVDVVSRDLRRMLRLE